MGTITNPDGSVTVVNQTSNIGGRIVRITPDGIVTPFAEGFNTSGAQNASSFLGSELSITFTADGTTLYASDDDGVWQFKTVASLAGSSSGTIIGLNDLRTLSVPYDGQGSAVAVIDTGVDANTPNFRGRVSLGTNVLTNGPGNDDFSPGTLTGVAPGTINAGIQGGVGSIVGGGGGGGGAAGVGNINGHGTQLAGVIAQFVSQATIEPVNIFSPFLLGTGGISGLQPGEAVTTNDAIYNGLGFVAKNPFVKDPVRPNTQSRVVAAAMGFGTISTFTSEGEAFRKYPQVIIAFKNQLKKLRSQGIAPVAAAGQFGQPNGQFFTPGTGSGSGVVNDVTGIGGDVNGMPLPAVLNEVITVTGAYSFPFTPVSTTPPTDPTQGVLTRPAAPVLVAQYVSIAGTPGVGAGTNSISNLTLGDGAIFANKIVTSSNRNSTTDFAAPEFDIPTFRRTFLGDAAAHNVFNEGGTSLSSGIVTGSFALVSSAIDYWSTVNAAGSTADAYLTTPVGVRTLNFGQHAFKDLSIYANPDSINAILQWTSVPSTDQNIGADITTPPQLIGSTHFREFSRIDVGNAIAAIEGTEALNYLIEQNTLSVIDGNKDGLISAQEIQTFVDSSTAIGMPEAGAMARLLGGNARSAGNGFTFFFETPDQPDALQRRFNFFDYASDGQINGVVSIDQFKMLAKNLLPVPDAYVVVDRQRASANGYLLDPTAQRNYLNLQHLKPSFMWVPPSAVKRYRGITPARFHVNKGLSPENQAPFYTLFHPPVKQAAKPKKMTQASNNSTTPTNTTSNPAPTATDTLNAVSVPVQTSSTGDTTPQPVNTASAILEALKQIVAEGNQASLGTPEPAGTELATDTAAQPEATTPATATDPEASTPVTTSTDSSQSTEVLATTAAAKPAQTQQQQQRELLAQRRAARVAQARTVQQLAAKQNADKSSSNDILSSFLGIFGIKKS